MSSRDGTPTPESALGGKTSAEDASKLKTFLSILKKFIGVSDIAAVRFSLPAQLLEPIPNLEYWHYLDRPDAFISIGDSQDPLGRMLGCLRFWFTKDLVRTTRTMVLRGIRFGIWLLIPAVEVRSWQAMQAIQFHIGRGLQGTSRAMNA